MTFSKIGHILCVVVVVKRSGDSVELAEEAQKVSVSQLSAKGRGWKFQEALIICQKFAANFPKLHKRVDI